jgi:hypothetical protein
MMSFRMLATVFALAVAIGAAEAPGPVLILPGGKEVPVSPQALLAPGAADVRVEEGNGKVTVYKGRPLLEVLEKAGLDAEGMPNQRALASSVVVATGRDGYAAVFSAGELLMHREDPRVYLVAATADGPLPEKQAPVRLIVVGQRARSAFALAKIEVRSLAATPAKPS